MQRGKIITLVEDVNQEQRIEVIDLLTGSPTVEVFSEYE